jgi:hypothetical protein
LITKKGIRKMQNLYCRMLVNIIASILVYFAMNLTAHAALYTVDDSTTSSLFNGFQIPTLGPVIDCDGDCGLNGDAVIVSFNFFGAAPVYKEIMLRLRTTEGYYLPISGAGYMDGTNISPNGVSRTTLFPDGILNEASFDFSSNPLSVTDATNSLFLTSAAGTLQGQTLAFRFRRLDDYVVSAVTPLTELQSVPIPGAIWLLGSGLIGIVGIRRKLKK